MIDSYDMVIRTTYWRLGNQYPILLGMRSIRAFEVQRLNAIMLRYQAAS